MHRKVLPRYKRSMAGILHRFALVLLCLLPGTPAPAQDIANAQIIQALGAARWAEAASLATDPLTAKLVTHYRLLAPDQASAAEISFFVTTNPDWPWRAVLERRRQEALARETNTAILSSECAAAPLSHIPALLRCAEAMGQSDYARRAWTLHDLTEAATEAAFLQRWAGVLRAEDHWRRFDTLLADNPTAAARQLPRLAAERQALARARLGLRQNTGDHAALLAAIPPAQRDDPALFLASVRALREQDRPDLALAAWRDRGEKIQATADAELLDRFWTERHLFARQRLRAGDADGAYLLAAGHGTLKIERLVDAQFLAGFIALRFLRNPAQATPHFQALAATSPAAITQGRAQYWLGRAAQASGTDPTPAFTQAVQWPFTFYGQLASLELGEQSPVLAARIRAQQDPAPQPAANALELARAAAMLARWGERKRAFTFLLRQDELLSTPGARAALARFALGLDMPEAAVAIARRMGRDGLVLPEAGWPEAASPPGKPIPIAVGLALIRQESAFEATALSPVGARGLMQLMPATAQAVAKKLGEATSPALLTSDPAHNMRLGTTYLHGLLEQFSALPLALAAYNAGPYRVQAWLGTNGDPRPRAKLATDAGATKALAAREFIDWIELIPFNETRNYVQRVLENIAIYRARGGNSHAELLAEWSQ